MDEKLKPRSFRVDEETAEKFRAIAQKINGNQQQTMSKLIEAYELCQSMDALPERKADIESFQQYLTILSTLFLNVVNEAITAKNTAKADFVSELSRNAQTITDLQTLTKKLKDEKSEVQTACAAAIEKSKQSEKECFRLQRELEEANAKHVLSIKDKEKLNAALSESNDVLKKKLQSQQTELEELDELRKHCSSLEGEVKNLQNELKTTVHEKELALHEKELALVEQKAEYAEKLLVQKSEYEVKMNELRDACSRRTEELQSKYMMLMEQNGRQDKMDKE